MKLVKPFFRLLIFVHMVIAASFAAAAATDNRIAEVSATQAARFQAMLDADVAALNDVLADDLVYAHTTGTIDSKSSMIENITAGAVNYELIEPTDTKIRLYGDVAVVTGSSNMRVSAGEQLYELSIRFIEVYVFDNENWRLVSWQSTRVP